MSSPLLKQLREFVEKVTTPHVVGARGFERPVVLLPQSHREEVSYFIWIGESLKEEKDTISPEEFREVLALLPEIIRTMRPLPPITFTTPKGITVEVPGDIPADHRKYLEMDLDNLVGLDDAVLVTNTHAKIVKQPEGVQLLLVSAPGIPCQELERMHNMIAECMGDPDFSIVCNYEIILTGDISGLPRKPHVKLRWTEEEIRTTYEKVNPDNYEPAGTTDQFIEALKGKP